MKSFLVTLVPLLALSAIVNAQTLEVVGIQLIQKTLGSDDSEKIVPFNTFKSGLEIAIGIQQQDGTIIDLDNDDSTLTKFSDDKGTNLIVEEFGRRGFGAFPKVSKDGKAGMISLTTPRVPAAGASEVQAAGFIFITAASSKKTEKTELLDFKKGTVFKVGKISFTMTKAAVDTDETEVELETNNDIKELASLRFIGGNGEVLPSDRQGFSSMGFSGARTMTIDYSVKGVHPKVIIEAEIWQDAKEVKIPFDLTVKLPVTTLK